MKQDTYFRNDCYWQIGSGNECGDPEGDWSIGFNRSRWSCIPKTSITIHSFEWGGVWHRMLEIYFKGLHIRFRYPIHGERDSQLHGDDLIEARDWPRR